jgi:hypothetical protein
LAAPNGLSDSSRIGPCQHAIEHAEASVKTRSGGANDEEQDLDLPYWTGVVLLRVVAEEPVTSGDCDLLVPAHVRTRANVRGAPSTV